MLQIFWVPPRNLIFEDEVDVIRKLVEKAFVIDWENSSDKRALIKADTFGYLSALHLLSAS